MLRLNREVRFAVHPGLEPVSGVNGFAGNPPLEGLGYFFALRVTLEGEVDPTSNYLLNIKHIDRQVRRIAVPLIASAIAEERWGAEILPRLLAALRDAWPARLTRLSLSLSPYLSLSINAEEPAMVRLSQKFEFSASHRLHSPAMSDEQNRETFGKCSNPHGHGHNYELQVTVEGAPGGEGLLVPVPDFERIVVENVIERFDHKNLNMEVPEFRHLIPSVENIAKVIYQLLKGPLAGPVARLASVTVWETPKTWCEYFEDRLVS